MWPISPWNSSYLVALQPQLSGVLKKMYDFEDYLAFFVIVEAKFFALFLHPRQK